jgi:hypothetical protein
MIRMSFANAGILYKSINHRIMSLNQCIHPRMACMYFLGYFPITENIMVSPRAYVPAIIIVSETLVWIARLRIYVCRVGVLRVQEVGTANELGIDWVLYPILIR